MHVKNISTRSDVKFNNILKSLAITFKSWLKQESKIKLAVPISCFHTTRTALYVVHAKVY